MFKDTFKDIITNILSVLTIIAGIIKVILDYSANANLDNWLTYLIGLMVAIGLWFIGKGSDGKAKKLLPIILAFLLLSSISMAQTQGAQTTAITNYKTGLVGSSFCVSFDFTQDSTGAQASPTFSLPMGVDPTAYEWRIKSKRGAVSGVPATEIFLQAVLADGDTITTDTLRATTTNQTEADTLGYNTTGIPPLFSQYKIFIRVRTADVDEGEFDMWWKTDPKVLGIQRLKIAEPIKY